MVSSFYSSNESKQRKYIKENKIRELNQEAQQEIVDEQIEKELGLESKATKLSALSKRITDKLVGTKPEVLRGDALLLRAINNSQLSDLFEKIKLLKDSALTKTQQSIRDNLNVQRNKDIINQLIQEAVPNGVEAIKSVVINALGGDGNQESVLELITKADKLNLKDFSKVMTSQERNEQKLMAKEDLKVAGYKNEQKLMAKEDVNMSRYPKIRPPPASKSRVIPKGAKENNERYLMGKEDVNIGYPKIPPPPASRPRVKQLISDEETFSQLTTLNTNQDYAIRETFDKELDDMYNQAKTYEQKLVLDKLKKLIEKQSMADAFEKWSNDTIKSAFADKIKKNLKMLLMEKKLNKQIAKQGMERGMMGAEDINYSLPIPKSRSNSNETTTTEQGSIAGVSNRGRPPPTKEEELARMYKKKQEADELFLKFIAKDKKGKNLYTGRQRTEINQEMKNKYAAADKIAKKYNLK